MGHGGRPWVSDFNHGNYQAARNALKTGTHVTQSKLKSRNPS